MFCFSVLESIKNLIPPHPYVGSYSKELCFNCPSPWLKKQILLCCNWKVSFYKNYCWFVLPTFCFYLNLIGFQLLSSWKYILSPVLFSCYIDIFICFIAIFIYHVCLNRFLFKHHPSNVFHGLQGQFLQLTFKMLLLFVLFYFIFLCKTQ